MILSNREIERAILAGRIGLNPAPPALEFDYQSLFGTHSLDVRLAPRLILPNPGTYTFDLAGPVGGLQFSEFLTRISDRLPIPEEGFALKPGRFVLGQTVEHLSLPIDHPVHRESGTCLAARFEGKSSRARTGLLVHFTAPTIHPGFAGTITLEIINLGPVPFTLRPKT